MIIQCESCSRKFVVKDNDIPKEGRTVQCGYCSVTWHQMPALAPTKIPKETNIKIRKIVHGSEKIIRTNTQINYGNSVRCIRDE